METTNYKIAGTSQNEKTMTSRILQVAIEVGLYVILATFDMLLAFNKVEFFLPFRRGFFCDDQNLMYPYKEMSFKSSHVALISVLPLTLTVLVAEFFRNRRRFKKLQYVQLCYTIIGPMLFGLSLCVFFVEMTKSCVGSLRPYFFAVCQPNMTILNCTDTEYITDYVCTQKYEDLMIDARTESLNDRRNKMMG